MSDRRFIEALLPRIHAVALGAAAGLTLDAAGYTTTWSGAFVGLAWGLIVGFAVGWLLGAVHNMTIGAWVRLLRTRADLSRSRNFIDQLR